MKYHTVHEAKTHLSRLIQQACAGEEVIIARGKEPLVKLVPIALQERKPGGFEGLISWTDEAFEPLTDTEVRELGFE